MFNLTICFGPAGTIWAFLFKYKADATRIETSAKVFWATRDGFDIEDDFGQSAMFRSADIHAILLEDLDQIEQARIQRALADERVKAKFMQAAKSDATIRQAMQEQTPVLTPFRGN
jgi:hypothetical protein